MTSIQQSEVGREFPFGVTSRQSMELEPRSHRQSDREHEVTERYTWFSSALCFLNSDAVFFRQSILVSLALCVSVSGVICLTRSHQRASALAQVKRKTALRNIIVITIVMHGLCVGNHDGCHSIHCAPSE